MISEHLNNDFFDFIEKNSKESISRLRLKFHNKKTSFNMDFALIQIECRQKTSKKLEDFLKNPMFIFPTLLSSEQASHQSIAYYHASLLGKDKNILDMTAGLGIDAISFARRGADVTAIELDKIKCEALQHNIKAENINNISVINADSVNWIKQSSYLFDTIFIDPARRGNDKSRLYNLHDCSPDVVSLQDEIMSHTKSLLIKASPMLDVSETLRDIENASAIHVVCVEGECKEILIEINQENKLRNFFAVDLNRSGHILSQLKYNENDGQQEIVYAQDIHSSHYLYEPNAAVMKLSPWKVLSCKFPNLKKLAPDSHIFISADLYDDFPGRIMRIEKEINKKDRNSLKGIPINIVSRNYPLSADSLRKDIGAKEGQDDFLYASRLGKKPVLLKCTRVQKR